MINEDVFNYNYNIIINVGKNHGIDKDMAVVNKRWCCWPRYFCNRYNCKSKKLLLIHLALLVQVLMI